MTLTDEEMLLYADGSLNEERKRQIIEAATHDAELAEILAALDASRLPFQAAFSHRQEPSMPSDLRDSLQDMIGAATGSSSIGAEHSPTEQQHVQASGQLSGQASSDVGRVWPKRFLQAACVLLSVGVGYVAGTGGLSSGSATQVATASNWVERVADYQSLYVPNTVRHITPDLQASAEKLNSLTAATGLKTAIPDLSGEGYAFVRAQELGFEGQPLVQLVYYKEGSPPLALCFMPSDTVAEAALKIETYHGLGTASWINDNQRYVIVAEESGESLTELHQRVTGVFKAS